MKNKISLRFEDLLQEINTIESSKIKKENSYFGSYIEINNELHKKWELNLKNLILLLNSYPDSMYYSELVKISELKNHEDHADIFDRQKALFLALKDDYEKGLLSSIKSLIEADVFYTELEQAKELLSNKYKLAAA